MRSRIRQSPPVIELDDRTHETEHAQKRDAFVDQALEDAQIPILRIRAQRAYDVQELRDAIRRIGGHQTPPPPNPGTAAHRL